MDTRVRSISQPMAEEFHQNSSMRSQNHSRHHHKIPPHPWREGIGNFSFQEEIWALNPSPTQWHSYWPWNKAPTAPKRDFKLKKIEISPCFPKTFFFPSLPTEEVTDWMETGKEERKGNFELQR